MAAITVPEVPEKSAENLQLPLPFSAVDESDYLKLLGLAEFFRTSQPPRIRETIHCLQATLSIETLPAFEKARCRLNLAKLLLANTKNVGHARAQLEQAVSSSDFHFNFFNYRTQCSFCYHYPDKVSKSLFTFFFILAPDNFICILFMGSKISLSNFPTIDAIKGGFCQNFRWL